MNLIDVDFTELKKVNSDVKGWIQVNGTNINYPFVQTKDTKFYLNHSFDKKYNDAGWVFLDYRNNIDLSNKNNIEKNITILKESENPAINNTIFFQVIGGLLRFPDYAIFKYKAYCNTL